MAATPGGQLVLPAVLRSVNGLEERRAIAFHDILLRVCNATNTASSEIHHPATTQREPFYIFKLIHLADSWGDLLCARLQQASSQGSGLRAVRTGSSLLLLGPCNEWGSSTVTSGGG